MRKAAVVLVAALALTGALTGCAMQDPHPKPLSRLDQVARYETQMRSAWYGVSHSTPGTATPDLTVHSISSGSQWVLDIAGCLRQQGVPSFTVSPRGQISAGGSGSGDNGVAQLAIFICRAEHPRLADLVAYLSPSQLSALYDYYVESLQPCLLMNAGRPAVGTPSRAAFISTFYSNAWSPYDTLKVPFFRIDANDSFVFTALGIRCPPFPKWLSKEGYGGLG